MNKPIATATTTSATAAGATDDALVCAPLDSTPPPEVLAELRAAVSAVAGRTIFLVHYYQPTWIKRLLADIDGVELKVADSQELARAGKQSDRELLFCVTVPFMAGSSAILARDDQRVVLADPDAGCSLESSAPEPWVERMLTRLDAVAPGRFVPVCYTNVSAEVKAVTGDHGGIIHTSSSAVSAFEWARARDKVPVFLPDRHLADNVAAEVGIAPARVALWRNDAADGAVSDEALRAAELIVWTGECSVHVRAEAQVVARFAEQHPEAYLVLHPEVPNACVRAALRAAGGRQRVGLGSTLFIRRKLAELAEQRPGTTVGIATESNFVAELEQDFAGRLTVCNLLRDVCACVNMRTRADQLAGALSDVIEDRLDRSEHLVTLEPQVKRSANEALSRSLELASQPFGLDWPEL